MKRLGIWAAALLFCLSVIPSMAASDRTPVSIDTERTYPGMKRPFSKGYEPTVKRDTMNLVIPFRSEEPLKGSRLTVGIAFEKQKEDLPFSFRNYSKEVKRNKKGVYLYQCSIALRKDRRNGQYPVFAIVSGTTQAGSFFQKEFTIYVDITDGIVDKGQENGESGGESEPKDNPENGEAIPEQPMPEQGGQVSEDPNSGQQGSAEESVGEKHAPKALLESCSLSGQKLKAGETLEFVISIRNCSSDSAMENVKFTLSTETAGLTFHTASWYEKNINSGNIAELKGRISVDKKAAEGSAPLQLQIEYDNDKGEALTATEKISLTVIQPAQASMKQEGFPEKVTAGDTAKLAVQAQNSGLSTVYNARARIESDSISLTKELFFGTIEPGSAKEDELSAYVNMKRMDEDGKDTDQDSYGDASGTIIFSYEDSEGKLIEQKTDFETFIKKPKELQKKEKIPEETSGQWITAIFAGVMLFLILLSIYACLQMLIYKRRLKIKKTT